MKKRTEIALQFERHKKEALGKLGAQKNSVKECQSYYAGDFDSARVYYSGTDEALREKMLAFNKLKPFVNAARGFMIQNRRKPRYLPKVTQGRLATFSESYTNHLSDYARENANADAHESRQDLDMLVGGYGAVETCIAYGDGYASRDPNGEILMQRLDPIAVYWDPAAREQNLLDAGWVFYKKEYDIKEAAQLFEDAKEEDLEEAKDTDEDGGTIEPNPDGGGVYSLFQKTYDYVGNDPTSGRVNIYFYQWYDIEPYWRVENPLASIQDPEQAVYARALMDGLSTKDDDLFALDLDSPILNCNGATKKALQDIFGGELEFIEFKRRVYYRATLSGKHVFNVSRNDSQQGFSIKFKTGDFDERKKIWVGMVTAMKDPALFYNKVLTEQLYALSHIARGGYFYESGAIEDERSFNASVLDPKANTQVAPGALQNGLIQPKRESLTATGLEPMLSEADAAMPEVCGIDRSFLGASDSRQETAALQRQRIKQAINTLASYFDSATLYQKEHARMMLDLMRIWAQNAPGLRFRMVDEQDAEQLVPLLPGPLNAEYDVTIEEAPDTATEKDERIQVLTTIGQGLLTTGDPAGKQFLAAAVAQMTSLDARTRRKLQEVLVPQQDAPDPAYVKKLEDMLKQVTGQAQQAQLAKLAAES
jgi:hypothetical protein